jgi:hypothetical protein
VRYVVEPSVATAERFEELTDWPKSPSPSQ